MRNNGRAMRGVALLTGGVLMASALFQPAPLRADDADRQDKKSKSYKTGAIVLGAAAAYMILKGKNTTGALAGAGAYYAYKKSKDLKRERTSQLPPTGDSSRDRYPEDVYGEDDDFRTRNSDVNARYPADGEYGEYGDDAYEVASSNDDPGYDGAYNGLAASVARARAKLLNSGKGAASDKRNLSAKDAKAPAPKSDVVRTVLK